jgi:hypothetical protein
LLNKNIYATNSFVTKKSPLISIKITDIYNKKVMFYNNKKVVTKQYFAADPSTTKIITYFNKKHIGTTRHLLGSKIGAYTKIM